MTRPILPCERAGKIQVLFGQAKILLLLASLGTLCAVLGTALHTAIDTLSIQSTTDDVVTDTGKVLNTAAADQNHGVLLQVVANTGNVSGNFHTVGQTHTGDLTQCGVGLLGGGGTNSSANTTLLRGRQGGSLVLQSVQTSLQCRCGGLVGSLLTATTNQLIKSRHLISPFFDSRLSAGIYSSERLRKNQIQSTAAAAAAPTSIPQALPSSCMVRTQA